MWTLFVTKKAGGVYLVLHDEKTVTDADENMSVHSYFSEGIKEHLLGFSTGGYLEALVTHRCVGFIVNQEVSSFVARLICVALC